MTGINSTKEVTRHFETTAPTCPHCSYAMTIDDMVSNDEDLFALAPDENTTVVECPSCDQEYWLQGSYKPYYTSALAEEEL